MKIAYCLIVGILMTAVNVWAQDKCPVKFGKVSPSDFELPPSKVIDSSAGAVIVADVGNSSFKGNSKGWFSLVFKKQVRIKILDKKAFDLATVEIPLYHSDQGRETLDKLEASTYNLESGKVIESKLSSKDIFEEKVDLNFVSRKFTLPAVKEGSIIEYSYTIQSDFDFLLKSWTFQDERFPCLWSDYTVTIPALLVYTFTRQGYNPFYIDKQSENQASYTIIQPSDDPILHQSRNLSINTNNIKHQWVMKDVPPFYAESYVSSPRNYLDKVSFQLTKTYDGESYHDYFSSSWGKATTDLLSKDDFGGPLGDNNAWVDDDVKKLTDAKGDQLTTARNIYYYIQKNFTCTNHYDKYIKTTLRDLYKKKSGGVGEINLLLAVMLQKSGITADPVLLSTRDFGFNNAHFPFLEKLNYVIIKSVIEGKTYYLDATRPLYGFGKLSPECYNGHARVISIHDSTSFYLYPDDLKESSVTAVFIGDNGKEGLKGTYESRLGEDGAHDVRVAMKESSQKTYLDNFKTSMGPDISIDNLRFDSLDNLEAPITMHYNFGLKKPDEDVIYFNPMMNEAIRKNPFKASERKYPVEMPYTIDELYVFTMEIPEGYVIDDYPKPTRINFNNGQGQYEFLVEKSDTEFKLKRRLVLKKAYFGPDDYEVLRNLYTSIVKKESETLVLKKKK